MPQDFLPYLCQALRENNFYDLARVRPAAEMQVAEYALDYLRLFPGHAKALANIATLKDDIERHHVYEAFGTMIAKWFTKRLLVEETFEEGKKTEEDKIWAMIQPCRSKGFSRFK